MMSICCFGIVTFFWLASQENHKAFSRRYAIFRRLSVCYLKHISFIHSFHIGWNTYTHTWFCVHTLRPLEHIILGFVKHVSTNLNFAVVQCTYICDNRAAAFYTFKWVAIMITAVLLSFVLHDMNFILSCSILATFWMNSVSPKELTACRTSQHNNS